MADLLDSELNLLENLYHAERKCLDLSQRELAAKVELSLGMTNALLRRFIERGWVKLTKINKRKIRYAITPEGVKTIAKMTVRYFTRAARNASVFRDITESFVRDIGAQGYTSLMLLGPEELDFLFDYACAKRGIRFLKPRDIEASGGSKSAEDLVAVRFRAGSKSEKLVPPGTLIVDFESILAAQFQENGFPQK